MKKSPSINHVTSRISNTVLQEGLIVDRNWLRQRGVSTTAIDYYLRSGKLASYAHGLYRIPGPPLKWQNIVHSLNVLDYNTHIGHATALTFHGFDHYLRLGKKVSIMLYSLKRLPQWVDKIDTIPSIKRMKPNPFDDNEIGTENVPFGTWDWPIRYSSAERAFIEFASTIDTEVQISQTLKMLEGAVNLRPRILQTLLQACNSIKTKRLFLWLARTAGHSWYKHLDVSTIDLGKGKRQIVVGGMLDVEYFITVPREVQDEIPESKF